MKFSKTSVQATGQQTLCILGVSNWGKSPDVGGPGLLRETPYDRRNYLKNSSSSPFSWRQSSYFPSVISGQRYIINQPPKGWTNFMWVNHQQNLVGGFNPYEKYSSKWKKIPQFSGWKIKKIFELPPPRNCHNDMSPLMILLPLALRLQVDHGIFTNATTPDTDQLITSDGIRHRRVVLGFLKNEWSEWTKEGFSCSSWKTHVIDFDGWYRYFTQVLIFCV